MFHLTVGVAVFAILLYNVAEFTYGEVVFPEMSAWLIPEPRSNAGQFMADTHFIPIILGIVVFLQLSRGAWFGVNDAYATILLCVLGVGLVTTCAVWMLVGLYPEVVVAGTVLVVLVFVSCIVVPRGIRLMRLVFAK